MAKQLDAGGDGSYTFPPPRTCDPGTVKILGPCKQNGRSLVWPSTGKLIPTEVPRKSSHSTAKVEQLPKIKEESAKTCLRPDDAEPSLNGWPWLPSWEALAAKCGVSLLPSHSHSTWMFIAVQDRFSSKIELSSYRWPDSEFFAKKDCHRPWGRFWFMVAIFQYWPAKCVISRLIPLHQRCKKHPMCSTEQGVSFSPRSKRTTCTNLLWYGCFQK